MQKCESHNQSQIFLSDVVEIYHVDLYFAKIIFLLFWSLLANSMETLNTDKNSNAQYITRLDNVGTQRKFVIEEEEKIVSS